MSVVANGGLLTLGPSSSLPVEAIYAAMLNPAEFQKISDKAQQIIGEAQRTAEAERQTSAEILKNARETAAILKAEAEAAVEKANAAIAAANEHSSSILQTASKELEELQLKKLAFEHEVAELTRVRDRIKDAVDAAFAERERFVALAEEAVASKVKDVEAREALASSKLAQAEALAADVKNKIDALKSFIGG